MTVFTGPSWQVDLHRGRLESEGIAVFVPDASTKIVDPFATGLNPLAAQLQVPADAAERASEILATDFSGDEADAVDLESLALSAAGETEARPEGDDPDADDFEDEDADAKDSWTRAEVESLATRTRWAALLGITIPLALMYGLFYVIATRESGIRAAAHRLTLCAIGVALLSLLLLVGLFLR